MYGLSIFECSELRILCTIFFEKYMKISRFDDLGVSRSVMLLIISMTSTTTTATTTQYLLSAYCVSSTMFSANYALFLLTKSVRYCYCLYLTEAQKDLALCVGIIAQGRKLWCSSAQALTWGEGMYCEMSRQTQATSLQSHVPCPSPPTDYKTQLCPFLVSSHPWCAGCGIVTRVTSQGTGHVVRPETPRGQLPIGRPFWRN